MQFGKRTIGVLIIAAMTILAGCAASIPPEKQGEYGLLQPKNKWMISRIDGEKFYSLAGTPQNVLPGRHTIVQSVCPNTNNCVDFVMRFEIKAGLKYDLGDSRVYDRFTNKQLGTLWNTSGDDYIYKATVQ